MNYNYLTPQEIEKAKKLEALKQAILRKILTKEAKERLSRVKMVKPALAEEVELYLVQLYQAGQLKSVVTEEQIKAILSSVARNKKFRIIR